MAINEKASEKRIPGLTPGSKAINRRFWDDPFVEPKQQHRFGIIMPVYMPMGGEDTTEVANLYKDATTLNTAALISTSTSKEISLKRPLTQAEINAQERAVELAAIAAEVVPGAPPVTPPTDTDKNVVGYAGVDPLEDLEKMARTPTKDDSTPTTSPLMLSADNNWTSTAGAGLYLRASEYVGFSFTPPGLTFSQEVIKRAEVNIAKPEDRDYFLSDATIVLVSTLRDDLHWSLNFLFSIAFREENADPFLLFPDSVISSTSAEAKILVVKEYSARQDSQQSGWFDAATPFEEAEALRKTPPRVVGIHKFNNPVVNSVSFEPFTYGGTDLVKVTMQIGYTDNQQDWYSYETMSSRYERDYFTWKDDTQDSPVPAFDKARKKGYAEYPNQWSVNREAAAEDAERIRVRTLTETYGKSKDRTDLIRERMEEGNPIKINEMVTKSIQVLLDEQAAADAAARDERAYRDALAASTPSFEDQATAEADAFRAAHGGLTSAQMDARELDRNLATPHGNAHLNRGGSGQDFNPFRRTAPEFVEPAFTDQQSAARRQISRLSNNQSAAGSNVSEFGKED